METVRELPRDVFINEIREAAIKNKNIYFISADLGAKALDRFRAELENQFIHAGISEQNMIDLAAGMTLSGKIGYVYAMAPFVTLRCFEQIKVAIASMRLPLTIVGIGAGYSYDDAGPTHYATEDVSCMRALGGIEILSPSDTSTVIEAARLTYTKPHFRYVRLDRTYLPSLYNEGDTRFVEDGMVEVDKGKDICIMSSGYMIHRAKEVRKMVVDSGIDVGVIDVFRFKPIDGRVLMSVLQPYRKVVTLEEHFLSGGLGSAVVEALVDHGIVKEVKRIGIRDQYYCENGGRAYLQKLSKIDVQAVSEQVKHFAEKHHSAR